MGKLWLSVCTLVLALGLAVGDADAARLGGGKSLGMQRQSVAPRPVAPAQQIVPAPRQPVATPTPATPTPTPAPRRNWFGPLAGIAAGLGLGALLAHFGLGEAMSNVLTLALLALAAAFVWRWLTRRNAPVAPRDALQYAGGGSRDVPSSSSAGAAPPIPAPEAPLPANAPAPVSANVPADFDSAAFLRVAKVNFVRLQAANDARNVDDLREFVSPEMYAEFKLAIDERGNAPQQTEVVTLDAELLELVTEGERHIASVRFSGMLREAPDTPAAPFAEIWHLAKPVSGERGWVVAGIQQLA